jgi:hypothetical protein
MTYTTYRGFYTYAWRFSASRSVQHATSERPALGGETLARGSSRSRTPSPTRLRA